MVRFSCCMVLLSALANPSSAQTFTELTGFDLANGGRPGYECLVQGTDGNLYGTTTEGGPNGSGTIFKITTSGAMTVLYGFNDGPDGANPSASLMLGADGNFYGTTEKAGSNNFGTIFKITPDGVLTTLHSFAGPDGVPHNSGLIQAADGDLYGTTEYGGSEYGGGSAACPYGCGTFFKITTSGDFTTLRNFAVSDGVGPYAGVIQGGDGNFYGTTLAGGANNAGTAFRITATGGVTTLYSFCALASPFCYDGNNPSGGLMLAIDGNFYGTTAEGGTGGYGTIYKLTPEGSLTTLHDLGFNNGIYPFAGLVQGTDGNFYGTTEKGSEGGGTLFKITYGGALTVLYSLGDEGGIYPHGGLTQATDGNFYGTTYGGVIADSTAYGTVFKLYAGLGPFVRTVPVSGRAGSIIRILGTDLTGATGLTFNGTAAPFQIVSATEIIVTVPVGATTGKIQVATPGGTLYSNVEFRVTQ